MTSKSSGGSTPAAAVGASSDRRIAPAKADGNGANATAQSVSARFDRIHAELSGCRDRAAAMRKEATQIRLLLWQERLRELPESRDVALQRVLDAALSVTCANFANVQLVDTKRRLVLTAHRGFGRPFLDFFEVVQDQHSACGHALRQRRPVVVLDVIDSPIFRGSEALEVMLDAGVRSVTSTPLLDAAGRIRGMLSVHYSQPRTAMGCDIASFQTLAARVPALIYAKS